ncbi:ABC transporter ATP-binding protein/permease [Corynebacterium uterequi]|uniref:ABC transporter ATP-binding protein n=1 Tax=Corynebacterium uterequi TaxID=1072256 RepID=A0A0G3HJ76_9CORY|nr:ABC transporter ATP-binding protein [Corynebacterium uterequi]AKK12008.1 ABC transporter ATP-binding protein [Corynebacterium uterequi]
MTASVPGAGSAVDAASIRATAITALIHLGYAVATAFSLISAAGVLRDDGRVAAAAWAVGAAIVAAGFSAAEVIHGGRAARANEARLRRRILLALFRQQQSPLSDGQASAGDVVSLATDNAERLMDFRHTYLGGALASLVVPFGVAAVVGVAVSPTVGVGLAVGFAAVPLIVGGFSRAFRSVSGNSRRERARLTVNYLDALRNLTPIRLFGAGRRTEERLAAAGEANRRAIMRLLASNQLIIIVLDGAFSLLLVCLTAGLLAREVATGAVTPAEALAVLLCLILVIEPLSQVAGFFYVGMGGLAAQRGINRYLATAPATPAAPSTVAPSTASSGTVALRHATYTYPGEDTAVLDGVDLDVAAGEKVALVGRSGAGKSTVVNLVRGGLRPTAPGQVFVDGVDVANLDSSAVRRLSAVVAQRTWLFHGTIADNLRIADPDATEEHMWDALRRAHLAEDVAAFADGLDSDVGERGSLLSGGQAQRLSLARAFLSGRRLLLLDEPTSQVDAASEEQIIAALNDTHDLSVLVVTHRPAVAEAADRVVELSHGRTTPPEASA